MAKKCVLNEDELLAAIRAAERQGWTIVCCRTVDEKNKRCCPIYALALKRGVAPLDAERRGGLGTDPFRRTCDALGYEREVVYAFTKAFDAVSLSGQRWEPTWNKVAARALGRRLRKRLRPMRWDVW